MTIIIDKEGNGRCDECGCEGEGIIMHSCSDVFKERIKKLEETNRLLCRDLDEAQKVVETRDERIGDLEADRDAWRRKCIGLAQ